MALSQQRRRDLLALDLPGSERVRESLHDYLQRTGLSPSTFAPRLGYSHAAIGHFLRGAYNVISSNDLPIRKAIVDFIERHPVAPAGPSAEGKLYETENVRVLRKHFHDALDSSRMYLVYGAPGSQKTFSIEHLIAQLNRAEISKNGHGRRAYHIYCPQSVRPNVLMKLVAKAAGSCAVGDTQTVIDGIRFDLRGRKALFVFDEAQHLDIPCLETIRQLNDLRPRIGILLAGSHQLFRTFVNRAAEMEQWNSRLHASTMLPGISEAEAREIIRKEVGQQPENKVKAMLRQSLKPDLQQLGPQGEVNEYISARMLFNSLEAIRSKTPALVAAKGVAE